MNYVNYFRHILTDPAIYHRQFDYDLPKQKETYGNWSSTGIRIASVSLPFISLYRPAGAALSIGMGGCRMATQFSQFPASRKDVDTLTWNIEVVKTALAVVSFASTVFGFKIGMFISTANDLFYGSAAIFQLISEKKYEEAALSALQLGGSLAYAGFMLAGALEYMLLFSLIQVVSSLSEARKEIKQERYIEAGAKLLMGGIKTHQAYGYYNLIAKRDFLLTLANYQRVGSRIAHGKEVRQLLNHPLSNLSKQIREKEVVMTDSEGKAYSFGSHFHGLGKELVKGENLIFRTDEAYGQEVIELEFKVNHVFREKINDAIDDIMSCDARKISEIFSQDIQVDRETVLPLGNYDTYSADKISVKGLGDIIVTSDRQCIGLHNRIIIRMDASNNLFDLYELAAFAGLEKALCLSSDEDIARLKMGHLFRTFFPGEAYPLERSEDFFTLSLEQLKEKMTEAAPEMEKVFQKYFEKMVAEETLPGRVRYKIPGLAEEAHEKGARCLTAAITGAYNNSTLFSRVGSILKMGMLSLETRFMGKVNGGGYNDAFDFYVGGADSVFTQMLTHDDCSHKREFNDLYYDNKVRLILSLDALETGTYQYYYDQFGNRQDANDSYWPQLSYSERSGILEFAETMNKTGGIFDENEVMLKERVAPSYIKGIIVRDEITRSELLHYLRSIGLVQNELILGFPVDQFIRVATRITSDLMPSL